MADVKFGIPQINNPTPSKVNFWVRVFTVIAAIFLAWMSKTNLIGPNSKDAINQLLSLALLLTNGLAPLFGIDINSNAKIPADQVTAMDKNK
jgi:hypothetical protein